MHITLQNSPFAKHSQYNFRHFVFLQLHTLDILRGRFNFKFRQFGQHSGVHGNGDKKQLQL